MRRPTLIGTLLVGITAACAHSTAIRSTEMTSGSRDAAAAESAVSSIITEALEADAAGRSADSLYNTSAVIVVNGRTRNLRPLFAGVGSGGQVSITSSQLEIRVSIGWGLVDYRWETKDSVPREGRATFVLTQDREGHWKIQHLHSSSPQ